MEAVTSSITLRDGTVAELHPMQTDDAPSLLRFHHTLSRETTHLRFFAVHPDLSAAELHRFTHVDHTDREAIVATVANEIVGVARFDRIGESTDAEVAFVVADSYQGHGLGTGLFDHLAARARQVGIARFLAETLPHNRRMQAVFQHAGLPVSSGFRDGVLHVVITLTDSPTVP